MGLEQDVKVADSFVSIFDVLFDVGGDPSDSLGSVRSLTFGPESATAGFDKAERLLEDAGKHEQADIVRGWRNRPGRLREVKPGVFVHTTGTVAPGAELGEDTVIGPKSLISKGAELGRGVVVDRGGIVWPDATIGPNTTIGANVAVMRSAVGSNVTLGDESIVYLDATLGDGSTVEKDGLVPPGFHVPPNTTWYRGEA